MRVRICSLSLSLSICLCLSFYLAVAICLSVSHSLSICVCVSHLLSLSLIFCVCLSVWLSLFLCLTHSFSFCFTLLTSPSFPLFFLSLPSVASCPSVTKVLPLVSFLHDLVSSCAIVPPRVMSHHTAIGHSMSISQGRSATPGTRCHWGSLLLARQTQPGLDRHHAGGRFLTKEHLNCSLKPVIMTL